MRYFLYALAVFLAGFIGWKGMTAPGDADVLLEWAEPTTRTDGSVLTASEILGYEIECTGQSATVVGNATSYTIVYNRFTDAGEKTCVIRTRATGDAPTDVLVSANSNPVNFTIDQVVVQPTEPGNLRVTVTNR